MTPPKVTRVKTQTKSSHIHTDVCFPEKSKFLFSMTPEVLGLSVEIAIVLSLQKNWKTKLIYLEQDRGKKGGRKTLFKE